MKAFLLTLREFFEVIIISLVTVFIVRTFLFQPFLVSGASMDPNFASGNYLIIDEVTYRFRSPERGEVIVFRYPGDEKTSYIKRIIGLPRERVRIQSGRIFIINAAYPDGFALDEPYVAPSVFTSGDVDITLDDNNYFMLGDNREHSFDSRSWGLLEYRGIIGIARLRLYPIKAAQAFTTPSYNIPANF